MSHKHFSLEALGESQKSKLAISFITFFILFSSMQGVAYNYFESFEIPGSIIKVFTSSYIADLHLRYMPYVFGIGILLAAIGGVVNLINKKNVTEKGVLILFGSMAVGMAIYCFLAPVVAHKLVLIIVYIINTIPGVAVSMEGNSVAALMALITWFGCPLVVHETLSCYLDPQREFKYKMFAPITFAALFLSFIFLK